jgi:hypothetical protein
MYTKFWSENLQGKDHLPDVDADGRIILQFDFKEVGCELDSTDIG